MTTYLRFLLPVMLVAFIASGLIFPALAPNGVAKITVEPPATNVTVSTEFTVDIWIRDLHVDMSSFSFIVNWDPALMEYVSHETYVQGNGWNLDGDVVGASTYGIDASGPAFGEDARWITITFHCLGEGSSWVDIGPSDIGGGAGSIPHSRGGATLNQIEPAPVGGLTSPINKLELLAPYLILTGLIVAVSAVIIKKRK
ncbi:cohesin domain-containing protein [Thermoproteota archaeon]